MSNSMSGLPPPAALPPPPAGPLPLSTGLPPLPAASSSVSPPSRAGSQAGKGFASHLSAGGVAVVISLTAASLGGMNYLYHMREQVHDLMEASQRRRDEDAVREARLTELAKGTEQNAKLADKSDKSAANHATVALRSAESAMASAQACDASTQTVRILSEQSKSEILIAANLLRNAKSYARESEKNATTTLEAVEEVKSIKDEEIVKKAKQLVPPVVHADALGLHDSQKLPYYGH